MLRKRIIPFLLSIFLLAGTFAVPASAEDLENASGSQTTTFDEKTTAWGSDYDTNSSFEINSVADLQAFATMVNEGKDFSGKTVTLKTDLDLSSIEKWIPIGSMNILDESYDYKHDGITDTVAYTVEERCPRLVAHGESLKTAHEYTVGNNQSYVDGQLHADVIRKRFKELAHHCYERGDHHKLYNDAHTVRDSVADKRYYHI